MATGWHRRLAQVGRGSSGAAWAANRISSNDDDPVPSTMEARSFHHAPARTYRTALLSGPSRTLLQRNAPESVHGRVIATDTMSGTAAQLLGIEREKAAQGDHRTAGDPHVAVRRMCANAGRSSSISACRGARRSRRSSS